MSILFLMWFKKSCCKYWITINSSHVRCSSTHQSPWALAQSTQKLPLLKRTGRGWPFGKWLTGSFRIINVMHISDGIYQFFHVKLVILMMWRAQNSGNKYDMFFRLTVVWYCIYIEQPWTQSDRPASIRVSILYFGFFRKSERCFTPESRSWL